MDKNIIAIVSGLPRSGTSMMMKMLEAGGIEPLTDNIRTPDTDNPKGYYEFERVKKLPEDTGWLDDAKGRVVKVLAELVKHLPDGYDYRIIFIQRKLEEVIASQKKMLIQRGEDSDSVSDEELMMLFGKYLKILKNVIGKNPNMDVIYVSYNDILANPGENISKINNFLDGILDEQKMITAIDERLYRNRYRNRN